MKKIKNHLKTDACGNLCAEKGFTLIETAFVVLIGGIIMSLFFNLINSTLQTAKSRENEKKFEFIQDEINRFVYTHGRYPCPARLTAAIGDIEFGREALSDCHTGGTPPAGVFQTTGRAGKRILIGAVPTRRLNLPDEFVADAYGGRFLYAVTTSMAESDSYVQNDGAITLEDANGNSVIEPPDRAPYVLVSHGQNKSGAYTSIEGVASDCDSSAGLSNLEIQNCNKTNEFITTLLVSDDAANFYDDMVATDFGFANDRYGVPSGSVIYFNLSSCPGDAWTTFNGPDTPTGLIACQKL